MFFRRKKPAADPSAEAREERRPAAAERVSPADLVRDAPSTQFLSGDPAADARNVQILLHATQRVFRAQNQAESLEDLLVDIVDRSVEATGAERGLLVMKGPRGELQTRVARSRSGEALEDERFSTTIVTRVLEEQMPVKATVQSDTEALELGQSVFDLKLRQVMCVPLVGYDEAADDDATPRPQGALYVDSRAATRQFKQSDLALFSALAQNISIAMQNARMSLVIVDNRRKFDESSAVQKHLMPDLPANQRGFDLHGWYRPADHAAGDFFDFVEAEGDALGVVVGDVSGHGIGPAQITAFAQGRLGAYLSMLDDLGLIFTKLNRELSRRIESGRFMTLFVALLHADGRIDSLNAGHQPALVWRAAAGRCEELAGDELAIGFSEDHEYGSGASLELAPGDALLAYTDGVIESRDPSSETGFLGRDGLARVFTACMQEGLDARATALRLADLAVGDDERAVDDDITLVVARRL